MTRITSITRLLPLIFAVLCALSIRAHAQATDIKETAAGTVIGRTVDKKIAFHGSTPSAQRAGSAQAAVTATVGAALATTAATNSTPYGFSQAQADGLIARVNSLRTDQAAIIVLLNELRAAIVAKGLIKGAP